MELNTTLVFIVALKIAGFFYKFFVYIKDDTPQFWGMCLILYLLFVSLKEETM